MYDISSDPDRLEVHTELNDTLTHTMTKQLKPRNYSLFRGNLRRCPVAHRHTRQIKGKHSKSLIGLLAYCPTLGHLHLSVILFYYESQCRVCTIFFSIFF